jgi:hypothetical protein
MKPYDAILQKKVEGKWWTLTNKEMREVLSSSVKGAYNSSTLLHCYNDEATITLVLHSQFTLRIIDKHTKDILFTNEGIQS